MNAKSLETNSRRDRQARKTKNGGASTNDTQFFKTKNPGTGLILNIQGWEGKKLDRRRLGWVARIGIQLLPVLQEKKKTERGSFGATQRSYAGWAIPGHTSQSNTARMRKRGGNRKNNNNNNKW